MEIEMFFAKYDVDGDGEFSMEEGGKLIEDLDNDRIDVGVRKNSDYSDLNEIILNNPRAKGLRQD